MPCCPPECMDCGAIDCHIDLASLDEKEIWLYIDNIDVSAEDLWPKWYLARTARGAKWDAYKAEKALIESLITARYKQDWQAMRFLLLEVT